MKIHNDKLKNNEEVVFPYRYFKLRQKIHSVENQPKILNYLDPNIGSVLFSSIFAIVSCVIFFLKLSIIKVKNSFFKGNEKLNNQNDIVIYSEGKQYWSVFGTILDEFEQRGEKVTYYTSDKSDMFFDKKYQFVTGKYIGNKNIACLKLAGLSANIVLMTIPGLNVLQLKRSPNVKHYSHIVHSLDSLLKYKLYSLDYYDSILCASDLQAEESKKLEEERNATKKEYVVVGAVHYDKSAVSSVKEDGKIKNILIAPSWGEGSLLNVFGTKIIDEVSNIENVKIIIRPHPQSQVSEKKLLKKLIKYSENKNNIEWDFENSNQEVMLKSDILITDFSSIIFDYLFLFSKPFVYSTKKFNKEIYDASDVQKPPFDFEIFEELGEELTESNLKQLPQILQNSLKNFDIEKVKYYKNLLWKNQQEAPQRVVTYLINKNEELKKLKEDC